MNTFLNKNSPAGVIRVTGEDAEDYLQSQWTINLRKLPVRGVRYGLRLSTKGRVLADSYFLRLGDEEFLLISKHCKGVDILSLLQENIVADEVEFIDETLNWEWNTLWHEEKNTDLPFAKLEKPEENKFKDVEKGFFFEDLRSFPGAFSLLLPLDSKWEPDSKWKSTEQKEVEVHRIKAGHVSIPAEIGPYELPQEGGLEIDAVDFNKGCYLGQEVMARLHAMGRVRRQSIAISCPHALTPSLPCPLFEGDKKIGVLKSLFQTGHENAVGMALIHEKGLDSLTNSGLHAEKFPSHKIYKL